MASLVAISHSLRGILSTPTFWLLVPIIVFEAIAEAHARRPSRRR